MLRSRLLYILLLLSTLAVGQTSSQRTLEAMRQMNLPYYEGNEMELLPSGEVKFQDMERHIRAAKRYINVEYFKFRTDSIGHAFFALLGEKMRQGVQVRVMYDRFGTRNSNDPKVLDHFIDSVRATGIPIFGYDPVRFPWINHVLHRDHRKIVVIDGEYAYTGGMNVCDYYIHGTEKVGEWRDMHVRMQGPVVKEFEHIFSVMWYDVSGEILELNPYYDAVNVSQDKLPMIVTDRQPHFQSDIMRRTYAVAIDNADSLIQIVNPYLTFVHKVRHAIYRALKRGVRVEIMASGNCDNAIVPDVIGIEMKRMMKRGAKVYYYEGGFHHTKVMTVDGSFCTVGSTNLDGRSLVFDFETNVFVFDPKTTQRFQTIFERDKKEHCTLLTPENWKQRFSRSHRLTGRLAGIAKRLL